MSKAKEKPKLRFAALIRVSTEKQATKGESLRTQDAQVTQAVASLGGVISTRYAGQEHATVGWEREQLEKLLADAAKRPRRFDAVIVADPSRWSRDNVVSEMGLETLRDNSIRFFVLTQEHDLNDDEARLYLGMHATISSYQARVQVRKSLTNRANRAKRGEPTSGTLPYGRTWDPKTKKWSFDKNAKAMMADVAKRYLAGGSIRRIAEEYGISESTLYDRLAKCGGKLLGGFHSDRLNIHETYIIDIPPLLDDRTIKAIRKKAAANKTFTHGHLKHQYLLNRMVFCGHCRCAMTGQFNNGRRYYRHRDNKKIDCQFKGHAKADDLEGVVMRELFDCFGNPKAVERAIEEATPNRAEVAEHQKQRDRVVAELAKTQTSRERILGHIVNESITDEQATTRLDALKEKEAKLSETLERLQEALKHVPSPEAIRAVSKQVADQFKAGKGRKLSSARLVAKTTTANRDLSGMTWDDRRALVQMVFSGKTSDGERMGVYIERVDGQKRWKYAIRGHLIDAAGVTFTDWSDSDNPEFGAAMLQNDLATKLSVVTKPGRWAPIPRQKCCRRDRSRRRAGG